jgi:hypothetical protein
MFFKYSLKWKKKKHPKFHSSGPGNYLEITSLKKKHMGTTGKKIQDFIKFQ